MIRTKEHNLRRALFLAIKTIAVFLAVLCAVQQPLDMIGQVAAADKDYYISELKLFQAKTVEEAKKLCESEGYYCSNKDLDAGTGKEAVVLGYKITEHKYEALYDIKLLHMNGGYTIKDFKEANAELEKSNSGAAEVLVEAASEFVVNYENKSPKALEAYTGLNLFSIPEANDMKLGDYILQGKADNAFFAKVITHASAGAVNAITNFLTTGLTPLEKGEDEETGKEIDITWAHKVKDSSLWSLLDSDDITEDELDEYDKEMGDDAQAMFKQLQRFTTELENGKASFNEEKTLEEAKNTNVTEVVDNTKKVEEEDTAMAYVNAYEFLNQYEANNGKPLGEYLADIGNETSESADLRKLYPVLEPMSAAQRKMVGMSGILSIISTLGENEKSKSAEDMINRAKKKMKEMLGTETFSIWMNTNPEMADKKVAFTSDAIRSKAATNLLDQQATDSWEEAKKTVNTVMKWINVGSAALGVLTFLASKYGLVGVIATIAAKVSTSVVATTIASVATKVIAISTAISSAATIFGLVILAVTLIFFIVTLIIDAIQKSKPKKYTTMPDFTVDAREINGIPRNVVYRAVKDNKNRIGDLNAYEAQNGWVCMYTSDDPNLGSPIRADKNGNVFNIVYGNATKQNGYECASYFGQITPGNCNTGAKNDDVNGIYINYYTEKSMANASGAPNQGNSKTSEGVKRYYSDMVVMSGKTAEIAKSKIIAKEGFQIYDQNLCTGARRQWYEDDQYYSYIGYKTTTNPDLAIRDIRVATFTSSSPLFFGQIEYACAGTLGFPANSKDENSKYPEDLDGLYFTRVKEAGTPIEVGKLFLVDSHSKAKAGWEPVTTFSGLPYNFATTRLNPITDPSILGTPGIYNWSYTGYVSKDDNAWNGNRLYMYYEPAVTYTKGTKYLAGIFFGFGTNSERGPGYYGSTLSNVTELFDRLKEGPNVAEPKESNGVNLAQSYFYKGHCVDSNQKYLRIFYTWTYNPYRALTDVQVFRGEPYTSNLPYTIEKALSYPEKVTSAADKSISYAAASVAVQRAVDTPTNLRGLTPENAYMAPCGLEGQNTEVAEGFTREKQGRYPFSKSEMPLLPTNLYVAGYVKEAPRLTLDDVVISRNKHDGKESNGKITCDVSGDYTLGGSKPVGDFCSIQDLQDPFNPEAFNISYPAWTDDGGNAEKTDEKNGSHFHKAGTSIYMYIKHETVKKKYISRVFVGAASREDAKSDNKDILKAVDKQVDQTALTAAVKAGSDEVILYDVAGDPAKSWYRYVKADDEPEPPDGGDPSAYVSVARTDNPDEAIRSIILLKSDAAAVAERIQVDNAVYYCASNTVPIKMNNGGKYYLYYSFNQGTAPGKPITEISISEDVFISGSSTALVVDKPDTTEIVNGKIKTTRRSKPYGDASMSNFIHAKYEADTVYFNKLFTASGNSAKEAQLALLEQDCTEFCNVNLNHNAGGKFVYFGYRGYSLNEEKINSKSSVSDQKSERESQLQEAVYDIICTVGEEFHPEGLITDRYQIYYAPVGKANGASIEPTNLNEGTNGPKIYMYYTTMYAVQNYNDKVKGDRKSILSTLPKQYLKSPLTKIGFALNDYVPASDQFVDETTGNTQTLPWEYVIDKDYRNPIDFNEGAVAFDKDHKTSDNRIAMFVQRDAGNVKPAAEITGGYSTASVIEGRMYLQK